MSPKKKSGVQVTRRHVCAACGNRDLDEVIALPRLPLTGIFVLPEERGNYQEFDQAFMRCTACGHGQLRDTISPTYLYQDTYTHRSSLSPISRRGNDFFLNFVEEIIGNRNFDCIAEIGCNDLYLLRKLAGRGKICVGFDPIWKDQSRDSSESINVHGKYVEEIDPVADLPVRPDLVLSAHTFEHVDNPLESLRGPYERAQPGALFVLEIPSLETLLTIGRFDQIFHQHLNYFSMHSLRRMIEELGGEFIAHRYNYSYWLGTQLVAFSKPQRTDNSVGASAKPQLVTRERILLGYKSYCRSMECLNESLGRLTNSGATAIGFGAAQMLPMLAYHMKSDLGNLRFILDDNLDKKGRTYPSIATTIDFAPDYESLKDYAVLITALDSSRSITERLKALSARYIVTSQGVF